MKKVFLAVAAIALLVACSKNEVHEETQKVPIEIGKTWVGYAQLAKGADNDATALKTVGFKASAFKTTSGNAEIFKNAAVTHAAAPPPAKWTIAGGPYYWPADATEPVNFIGYAPASITGVSTKEGVTITDFTVNATPANQVDLLYAAPADKTRGLVSLTFRHVLTKIVFSVTTDIAAEKNPKIVSIVLTANSKATFTNGTWGAVAVSADWIVFSNNGLSASPVTSEPMFMIPQTAGRAVITIEVAGIQSVKNVELTSLASAPTWVPNKQVTYNIHLAGDDLEIKFTDPTVGPWTPESGTITY